MTLVLEQITDQSNGTESKRISCLYDNLVYDIQDSAFTF